MVDTGAPEGMLLLAFWLIPGSRRGAFVGGMVDTGAPEGVLLLAFWLIPGLQKG